MSRCPHPEQLETFALGEVSASEYSAVSLHLDRCSKCQQRLAELDSRPNALDDAVKDAVTSETDIVPGGQSDMPPERHMLPSPHKPQLGPERPDRSDVHGYPTTLGQYILQGRIGAGGMGAVFKALHVKLDRYVALKLMSPRSLQDKDGLARFEREMMVLGRLDHPNIVYAHDAGEADGVYYLAMQLLAGRDLRDMIKSQRRLPVPEACELVTQAAAGLQCAHEQGCIHRDVKPSNLMLTSDGVIKVLDFGLAALVAARKRITSSQQILGTVDFMAPEQVSNSRQVTPQADIYSLGCTLFALLCGEAPFASAEHKTPFARAMAHLREVVPNPRARRDDIPQGLCEVIQCALQKEPTNRFSSAHQMALELQRFVRTSKTAMPHPTAAADQDHRPTPSPEDVPSGSESTETAGVIHPVQSDSHLPFLMLVASPTGGQKMQINTDEYLLGRDATADWVFDERFYSGVSRKHASIVRGLDAYAIRDLNSSNGTFVNGQSIRERRLVDGDEIRLGEHGPKLRFRWQS